MSAAAAYKLAPWKKAHTAYDGSVFNVRPAPEFATAEVLVASLYRAVGFSNTPEREVPANGREFGKLLDKKQARHGSDSQGAGAPVSNATWKAILNGVLESPKQPNQSSRRFHQFCPLVPDTARYSGSARLSGSSWNPGALIQRMIQLGSADEVEAQLRWTRLYRALSVTQGDDIWARWLQAEFEAWGNDKDSWGARGLQIDDELWSLERSEVTYPAQQFVRDLDAIIAAKNCMTRRQWVSLLEAVLRLGSVTHVLWLCDVTHRLWRMALSVLNGAAAPSTETVLRGIVDGGAKVLAYGNPALPLIRHAASGYLVARLGLNLVLWHLDDLKRTPPRLVSAASIVELLGLIAASRVELEALGVAKELADLQDQETRTVACKKGVGVNLIEFSRYALGQRQTSNEILRGYDQGYVLRKRGTYASAPWVVSLGPVAVLALVHSCLWETRGPRSVQRLCAHLASYGIDVDGDDVTSGDLGRQLRMLGLVLDSPDAESGMLLVPPFELTPVGAGGEQ